MSAEQASERKSGRGSDNHYSGCGTNVHSGLGVPLQGAVQGLTESSLPAPTWQGGGQTLCPTCRASHSDMDLEFPVLRPQPSTSQSRPQRGGAGLLSVWGSPRDREVSQDSGLCLSFPHQIRHAGMHVMSLATTFSSRCLHTLRSP